MATALFAWELGGGLGHILTILPLAKHLSACGHRVFVASDSRTSTTIEPANVASLTVTPQPSFEATEGQDTGCIPVASFTDAVSGTVAGDYQATIDWGDGNSSLGEVAYIGSGVFQVSGDNTFAAAGTLNPVVTIMDTFDATAAAMDTANVAGLIATAASPVSATEGQPIDNALLATFTNSAWPDDTSYSATIDWGDGDPVAATVTETSYNNWSVTGSLDASDVTTGTLYPTITITDLAHSATASVSVEEDVSAAPLTTYAATIPATQGQDTGPVTVATFADADPNATTDETATVDWGDGNVSDAAIVPDSTYAGVFDVTGDNVYALPGTYTVNVTINDVGGASTPVTSTASVVPSAPQMVYANPASASEIDLDWSPVDGVDGYIVNRSTDGTTWTQAGTTEDCNFSDTGLGAGTTYQYQVIATYGDPLDSAPTSATAMTLPAAPTGLTAAPNTAAGAIVLNWTDAGTTQSGYLIERSSAGSAFSQIATVPGADNHSYADQIYWANPSIAYSYRVAALNSDGGQSDYSNPATEASGPVAFESMNRGWETAFGFATGPYTNAPVARSENNWQYVPNLVGGGSNPLSGSIANVVDGNYSIDGGTATYELVDASNVHGTVTLDTNGNFVYTSNPYFDGIASFSYRLVENGVQGNLADVVLTPQYYGGVPAPTAQDGLAENMVTSWEMPFTPLLSVTVAAPQGLVTQNQTQNGNENLTAALVESGPGVNVNVNADGSFTVNADNTMTGRTWFTYKLNNGTEDSNYATVYLYIAAPSSSAPATPTNLKATATNFNQITLEWNESNCNVDYFQVERSVYNGNFVVIAPLVCGQDYYNDDSALPGTANYTYRVCAVSGSYASLFSAPVTLSVPAPAAPTNLKASAVWVSGAQIHLSWSEASGTAVTSFNIYSFSGKQIATVLAVTGAMSYSINVPIPFGSMGPWTFTITADNGFSQSAPATATALPVGGPDITADLMAMIADVNTQFAALSAIGRHRLVAGTLFPPWALKWWDMIGFPDRGFGNGGIGEGLGTVTVAGKVFDQQAVNYWLAGIIYNALLARGRSLDAADFKKKVWLNIYILHSPVTGTDVNGEKWAWFQAGTKLNPFLPQTPDALKAVLPGAANDPSLSPVKWHWGCLDGKD